MDAEGEVIETSDVVVTREALEAVIPEFTGEIEQTPPMYSAVKHGGKNLYDLARKGISVERKARRVTVKELRLVSFDGKKAVLDALVTKGTYIRVLADDIGRRLGAFAHLTALRRTAVGDLRIEDAVPFAAIDTDAKTTEEKRAYLKGADFLLQSLPAVTLASDEAARLRNGQRLAVKSAVRGEARAYGPEKNLLGVVEVDARGVIHPVRLIRNLENDPS